MTKRPRSIPQEVGYDAPVRPTGLYRILVDMSPNETLSSLAPFSLDYCGIPQEPPSSRPVKRLHAFADGVTIDQMRKVGRTVEVLADAWSDSRTAIGRLGPPDRDRFNGGAKGPDLVGKLI